MSQQFRLLLKAVALGRYLLTKNRIDRVSIAAKRVIAGNNTVGDVVKEIIPISKGQLKEKFHVKRIRKRIGIYAGCLAFIGFVSYEYHTHESFVPITNRKHFVILPRSMELSYQEGFINTLMNQFKESSTPVLDESSDYYILLKPIIDRLIDACIYFSPECEDYMKHLKILLVDSDELNAYTTMGISLTEMAHSLGSIIVINTGLIHHFEKLKKDGQNINIEECLAGILAHELSHSLSRHPVEAMLRWTGWAYYIYITLIPDLFFMPIVKGLFDKKASRSQEHEADFQALYLLKRSGYDPSSMIKTLSLLPSEEDDYEIVSYAKEQVDDHPRLRTRVLHLQDRIFWFQHDFDNRFTVMKQQPQQPQSESFLSSVLSFLHIAQ